VRIALNLKGIAYDTAGVSLAPGAAEHRQPEYRARNPQMLVPYLEETRPEPALLPGDSEQRAAVRSFCNSICCDIHPLNNLRVLIYLKEEFGISDAERDIWYAHWINEGFRSAEQTAAEHGGPFVFGSEATLAGCCLVPQIYNARRFNVALDGYPTLVAVDAHCNSLPAFATARPESQSDFVA
jgi:maleylacetoacetate isomerase